MEVALVDSPRHDGIWAAIRTEATIAGNREPSLRPLLHSRILAHEHFDGALARQLGGKLGCAELAARQLGEIFGEAFTADRSLAAAAQADLVAVKSRDPACTGYLTPLLHFSGFLALQAHRLAHWLWMQDRTELAFHLQGRSSEVFGIDIHPAARIGSGIMIDHGTGVVIGETAVVEDGVSMLHEVTLGGTGKTSGDRHPKVRRGVLIGAGAKILGNIEIGIGSRIGAGSVVLVDVAPFSTVVGVPARAVGHAGGAAEAIDHTSRLGAGGRPFAPPQPVSAP